MSLTPSVVWVVTEPEMMCHAQQVLSLEDSDGPPAKGLQHSVIMGGSHSRAAASLVQLTDRGLAESVGVRVPRRILGAPSTEPERLLQAH